MAVKGKSSALSNEIRAAGHAKVADKLEVLQGLHMEPERGQHRELTADEIKAQRDNALEVEEFKAAQAVEYGTWVAREDIFHGSALAYVAGHPVPVSNVERHGYDELGLVERVAPVAKTSGKTGD
jgi:hypothetical protein